MIQDNRSQTQRKASTAMVERRIELNRRYQRKKKMAKLKRKLAAATSNHDRDKFLQKILLISPQWEEPAK
jgi:hypothetical protein